MKSTATKAPSWKFTSTLRARAFGWRSSALAAKRLKEAVTEVKQAAKLEPQRAADGAVLLLGKIEPAFEQIDSSSGALGTAVNNAIGDLAPVVAAGSSDTTAHRKRLEKLFDTLQDDGMGYLDSLGDGWGVMCGTRVLAKEWADRLTPTLAMVWREPNQGWFSATSACLSSLLAAGEYQQILDLLALPGCVDIWHYRFYGVEVLRKMGRLEEALALARRRELNDPSTQMDLLCEEVLNPDGARGGGVSGVRAPPAPSRHLQGQLHSAVSAVSREGIRQMLRDLVGASGEAGAWFTAGGGTGGAGLGGGDRPAGHGA